MSLESQRRQSSRQRYSLQGRDLTYDRMIRFGLRNLIVFHPEEDLNAQRDHFLREWGIDQPEADLLDAFSIGVAEWSRRQQDADRKKAQFVFVQFVAPIAAALATVLAVSGISKWAVIPSATATVASSLLASLGLRENWGRLRRMSRELGFEIVLFAKGYGNYGGAITHPERIDRLMKRIEQLSIQSVYASSPRGEDPNDPRDSGTNASH